MQKTSIKLNNINNNIVGFRSYCFYNIVIVITKIYLIKDISKFSIKLNYKQ